LHNIYSI